jgi:GTP-binding protein
MNTSAARPVVAIIGRRNVGKSTLLNRLAGKRLAIVADLPGTTRDRVFADVSWRGSEFNIVDSGGLDFQPASDIARSVNEQVTAAINEADIILFVVDTVDGITATDLDIADRLRTLTKPVLLVANKADNDRLEGEAVEFFSLGLGEPLAISAYHGRGIAELLDRVAALLPPQPPKQTGPEIMKLAIVGRPNVGKSTLLNAFCGAQRAIVNHAPGTTRDAIDIRLDFDGQDVILIDTAGIKRRGRVGSGVERYSVIRALKAIDRADVVLLLLDATELVTAQDLHIAGYIQQAAKGVLLLVNKWDLAMGLNKTECSRYVKSKLRFIAYAPLLFISAKLGQGVDKVIGQALKVYQERLKRIATAEVNSTIQQAAADHSPPRSGSKQLKLLYATQAEVNPPTFVFFVNDARLVHFSYRRYLENRLRRAFGFDGTPLRLVFKTRGEQC